MEVQSVSYPDVQETLSPPSPGPLPRRAPAASFTDSELGPPPPQGTPAPDNGSGPAGTARTSTR
jgi:hypothetical protein